MNVSRETVSLALFALFAPLTLASAGGPFQVVTRTLRPFTGIDPTVLPYLCLVADDEGDEQKQAMGLARYSLKYYLWLYCPVSADQSVTPETILNNCLDVVDLAIRGPILGQRQFLGRNSQGGPLVTNAWIDGQILKHVGIVGQGMPSIARIPITVLTGA